MEDGIRSSEKSQRPQDSQQVEKKTSETKKETYDLVKSPCKALTARRHELGLTEEEVASRLKITVRQIQALESGNYKAFKGITFARGFVRAYARLMDLDPTPLVAFFAKGDGAAPSKKNIKTVSTPEVVGQTFSDSQMTFRKRSNAGKVILALIVLAVIIGIGAFWYAKAFPWHKPTPKDQVAEQQAPAQQPAAQQPTASAAGSADAKAGPAPLKLTFTREVWVQIQKEDGKTTIAQFVGKPGETKQMDVEVPATIVIGNIKGVSMEFRNESVDLSAVAKGNTAKMPLK